MSEDNGKSFTNVFNGRYQGERIRGDWADVPRGGALSNGKLVLFVVSRTEIKVMSQTGGFGGTIWTKK